MLTFNRVIMQSKTSVYLILAVFVSVSVMLSSCYKIESGSYIYKPIISLPVGTTATSFADIFSELNLYPAPSDTTRIDSIPVLLYNDQLFYTPYIFDTVYYMYFSFEDIADRMQNTREIIFRVNYTNHFPTRVSSQLYFLDGTGNVLDSLMSDGFYEIDPASTDGDGNVISPTSDRVEIPLSREKIDRLSPVQMIAVKLHMHLVPDDNGVYRFYSNQLFEMQIALRLSIELELDR
jgi:hypothetical protein